LLCLAIFDKITLSEENQATAKQAFDFPDKVSEKIREREARKLQSNLILELKREENQATAKQAFDFPDKVSEKIREREARKLQREHSRHLVLKLKGVKHGGNQTILCISPE